MGEDSATVQADPATLIKQRKTAKAAGENLSHSCGKGVLQPARRRKRCSRNRSGSADKSNTAELW